MVISLPVINIDKKSKKGYTYTKDLVDDAINDSALQARLSAGSLWCEVVTSDKNKEKKEFSIYELNANHLCGTITKIYWKDKKLFIDLIPYNYGDGKKLIDLYNSGKHIRILLKEVVTVRNSEELDNIVIAGFAWLKEKKW